MNKIHLYTQRALLLVGAVLLALTSAQAGTATYDFNAGAPAGLVIVGNAEARTTGGVNNSGYLALFDSVNGQHSSVLIPDFDKGLVVKSFTFEVDLRIGNAIGNSGRPADGFSISFARANDPVVADLTQDPPVDDIGKFAVASGPENGTSTGLAICFDTWSGNTLPGNMTDLEGIEVIVDDVVQIINGANGIPMTTRNGACTDATSLQTGPWDGLDDGTVDGLCWAHLKVTLDENGQVSVNWKGTDIVSKLQTKFAPSAGRIVFAGRTGGANENTHIDNLTITTVPSDKAVIGGPKGQPAGFTVTVSDSGASVFDSTKAGSIVDFQLNGKAITASTATKDATGTSTLRYSDSANPIPPGSTNTVILSIKDGLGAVVTKTNTFIGISYTTLDPSWVATPDTTKPGFTLRIAQVDLVDAAANSHPTDVNTGTTIAAAERILHGDLGPNTADLALYTGAGKTYAETKVINYNAAGGDIGSYLDDGTVAGGAPSPNLPGLPGAAARESGNDDVAMEILTYIDFPKAGAYQLIFNSDDGFRTTVAPNPLEQLNSKIVSVADVGRGAADTINWVYVSKAGAYGFRTVWIQGGGGANMEWAAINDDGVKALINDTATAGALKAYRVNTAAMPAAISFVDPPRASGRPPTAAAPVVVEITDGATAVSNIKFNLNGKDVTPVVTKTGSVSKAVYTPSPLLPANNTLIVSFTDGAKTYSGTNTFTATAGTTVPASLALKAADVDKTKTGFLIKTTQVFMSNNGGGHNGPGNSTLVGEELVRGLFGWPNVANLTAFTGPGSSFVETGVINYNGSSGNAGTFLDDGTAGGTAPDMPGIDGNAALPDAGIDDYALEIRTVLDLQPGVYEMGVNSDDGFRLIVGSGADAFTFPVVVGEYNGGRGADNWGFTRFSVQITQAGLYPFRMVFEEGGGGNNVEWFTINKPWYPDMLNKVSINDTANGGVKAYQYPINNIGPTYVKSVSPARSSSDSAASVGRAGPDATVSAVIVDGSTPVDKSTIVLKVNGTAVTATVAQAAGQTTVSYKPAAGFAAHSTNTVDLTYTDRTVSWSFIVGLPATPTFWIEAADFNYGGGQTKPEASAMPYTGGAYAGLGAVAGTDYDGPNDSDNPYYRYPNTVKVPVSNAADFDRGSGEVVVDYRLGWMGGKHWFNYTRTFPAGTYNVYAGLSSGTGGDHIFGNLEDVTGGSTTILGSFSQTFVATGGGTWGNSNLVPLKDAAGTNTVVALSLSGTKTLRYNDGSGDFEYLLFTPVGAPAGPTFGKLTVSGGNLTITWTGGGSLQSSVDLKTWADVANSSSGTFTTPTSSAHTFYRVKM